MTPNTLRAGALRIAIKARTLRLTAAAYGLLVALLLAAPMLIALAGQGFYLDLLTRALILAIAVASLNLLVGYSGLISLGHAAYIGIGAYSVGIPVYYEIHHGALHLLLAIGCSAAFAALTGAICLRTKGLYFILITLAFSQMLYFIVLSLDQYGADDGLVIARRSEFGALDLENATALYYTALATLLLCLALMHRLLHARFGKVILGAKHNAARMQAIGFDTYRYQLVCYIISGAMCGVAGFLMGNFTNFISPEMMDWTHSAELLFMLIIGGAGALFAPLTGAGAFIWLEESLSALTVHWHLIFGLLLIALVLRFGKDGLHGVLLGLERRRARDDSIQHDANDARTDSIEHNADDAAR
ncbi:MAG: branched-chain amino acid ABC transporter permease [bacterium]